MEINFQLQPDPSEIGNLARDYSYPSSISEEFLINDIAPRIKQTGYIQYEDFLKVCEWKTSRSKSRVRRNTSAAVQEISRLAFNTQEEALRIGLFTLLFGVRYPTASVFLHFFHPDPYPILDIRALEALGETRSIAYTFDFWWEYVLECRKLAERCCVDMRTLDKGLWQWSVKKGQKINSAN